MLAPVQAHALHPAATHGGWDVVVGAAPCCPCCPRRRSNNDDGSGRPCAPRSQHHVGVAQTRGGDHVGVADGLTHGMDVLFSILGRRGRTGGRAPWQQVLPGRPRQVLPGADHLPARRRPAAGNPGKGRLAVRLPALHMQARKHAQCTAKPARPGTVRSLGYASTDLGVVANVKPGPQLQLARAEKGSHRRRVVREVLPVQKEGVGVGGVGLDEVGWLCV